MNKLLFRILSGQIIVDISGKKYIINTVSYANKYLAEEFHEELIEQLRYEEILSKDNPAFIIGLYKEGLKPSYKEDMKAIAEKVDELKLKLYEIVNEKGDAQALRNSIKKLNDDLLEILGKLHQKDSITIEGMAEFEKTKFLLRKSLNRKVSELTLDKIISWITKNYIKEEDYRKIARSNLLSNIIEAGDPFKNHPLTDEQITLMYWYRFYKNVMSHPEKPFDWVIEDDWALDGWCIKQNKKNKASDAEQYVESKMTSDAVRNSTEVYIPRTPGTDMAAVIDEANSPAAKTYKDLKFALINKGKMNESNDIRLTESFTSNQ